ncbi:MAG: PIN domain-containing protein [Candidatus Binatia bacterium]
MPAEFVDSNILVYAYDRTAERKFDRARELVEQLWEGGNGVLSTQVLEEFYVTVTAKIPNPLKPREARQIILDLGTWKVALLEALDIVRASEIAERYRLNFWDGLILAAAHKEEAAIVWSEDLSHGQKYGETTVYNPFLR